MFTQLDIITPVHMKSVDGPKGRFYTTPSGAKYPSITTVLGAKEKPWLQEWRTSLGFEKADKEMKRAAERGTAVHLMLERHLQNDPNPTLGQKIEHITEFNSLKMHIKKINNIVAQEIALCSDLLKVAGRVDCIADFDGKLSLIDFKTSNRDKNSTMIADYYKQTTFYALAFQEMYNIEIEDIVIIMSVEKGLPLIFKEKVDNHIDALVKEVQRYHTKV